MTDMQPMPNAQRPAPPSQGSDSAFALLHPGVQKQLWRMGWKSLRPLQVKAVHALLESDRHVILSAATASGKTEAAFLPILSRIADAPLGSVRAVYVGPLKALINDQFRRVEDLCGYLDVPVHRWHGDVGAGPKARLIDQPGGVLLITPESLESLLVNRSEHLGRVLGGLQFVVIDELHSFLDNERGLHLRSLLGRIGLVMAENRGRTPISDGPGAVSPPPDPAESRVRPQFRVAGLSATIGEMGLAQKYVDPARPGEVQVITNEGDAKEIKYRIYGYRLAPPGGEEAPADAGLGRKEIARQIVEHCRGQSNLIFANAKADVEEYADWARQIAAQQHLADVFLVHHGSLSADIRQDAEETMKSGRTATTFCSSTLEMGIDIGSVRMVGQIGPSWSVSSLLQRMGRSGRHENEPRIMRVYIECAEPGGEADVFDRLHLGLVQAAAITELMLEKWMEPPHPPACDLSTLTQQVISVIAQTGGRRADELYERLCGGGAFGDIEPALFASLLRRLGSADVIGQMEGDDLILGLVGEKLRRDRGFYAVFRTAQEYAILHGGQSLGTLEIAPQKDEHLLFAGKRWRVVQIDDQRKEVHVEPASGYQRTRFTGGAGEVHPRIRRKMREVLAGDQPYAYLDGQAASLLADARSAARSAGICEQPLIGLGPKRTAVMTWTGTRIQNTLQAMLACHGVESENEGIALVLKATAGEARAVLAEMARQRDDPLTIAAQVQPRERRKYDWLLGEDLLNVCVARSWLDLDGAAGLLPELLK